MGAVELQKAPRGRSAGFVFSKTFGVHGVSLYVGGCAATFYGENGAMEAFSLALFISFSLGKARVQHRQDSRLG